MQTWEGAVRMLLADPAQRQVVLDCYYDQPASAAALRYCASAEWAAVKPMIPDTWDWFRLEHLHYHGKSYTIIFDRTGKRYGGGAGLRVVAGRQVL